MDLIYISGALFIIISISFHVIETAPLNNLEID